uniref:hypothetical protein n=1 Tax=Micromonospora acroterricola TaxID=2202421 RepID=UPI00191BFF62|nr:hypothetical protein [Micromonospora acroterricola]
MDVGERLGYLPGWQMLLPQLVNGLGARVDLGDVTVAPGHVVVRVDHDLAGQRLDRHVVDDLEGHGDDREVAGGAASAA